MRSKVIKNCRYVYEMFIEKFMEFANYIKIVFRQNDEYQSNLVEIYKIKERYINNDFVKGFLKERQKSIAPDRYKIEITVDHIPGNEEVIGEVMLMRKNKLIEKAELVTNPNVPDTEKLVYWKFR